MKLKNIAILGVTAFSLGVGLTTIPNQAQASIRGFSRSWTGTYFGPQKLSISTHYLKLGAYRSRVSYITKATHGYYHIHFATEQPLWLKRKGHKIALRYLSNDHPEIYIR